MEWGIWFLDNPGCFPTCTISALVQWCSQIDWRTKFVYTCLCSLGRFFFWVDSLDDLTIVDILPSPNYWKSSTSFQLMAESLLVGGCCICTVYHMDCYCSLPLVMTWQIQTQLWLGTEPVHELIFWEVSQLKIQSLTVKSSQIPELDGYSML